MAGSLARLQELQLLTELPPQVCVAAFRAVDCVQADCAFECVQAAMEIECGVHGLEGECSIGITVRARPGRSSALIIFHSRSILYGASA